jgi:hypothetical protein
MESFGFSFSTEYYQFYILDSKTKAKTDAENFWCTEADERRLAIGDGLLGVTIATYGKASVELLIRLNSPETIMEADHIVEASIRMPSGLLQVKNCTAYENQFELPISKGTYRVRISSHNLKNIGANKIEDCYTIEMWKNNFTKPQILKSFEG